MSDNKKIKKNENTSLMISEYFFVKLIRSLDIEFRIM